MNILPLGIDEETAKKLESLRDTVYTGEACGGMVKVMMSFMMDCVDVKIDPEAAADPELLEDLVHNAVNAAIETVRKVNMDLVREMHMASMGKSIADCLNDNPQVFPPPTMAEETDEEKKEHNCETCAKREMCPGRFMKGLLADMEKKLAENTDKPQ